MIRLYARPDDSLLARYAGAGAHTDCYGTEVPGEVSLQQFVEAFYTGRVFKLERLILHWFAKRPSTDAEARQVAAGERTDFAAWRVEDRADDQLLMSDYVGRTRSWFMVAAVTPAAQGAKLAVDGATPRTSTRLYFGSAVVPVMDPRTGEPRMGWVYRALLGFHRMYSRVLLRAAAARLSRSSRAPAG